MPAVITMMNAIMNQCICSFLYSLYDAGKSIGITVSQYSSRVCGYQIGIVKGNEIAQEVCFITVAQLVLLRPQLIVLITMAESIFQKRHINYSNVIPSLLVLVLTLTPIMTPCCGIHTLYLLH